MASLSSCEVDSIDQVVSDDEKVCEQLSDGIYCFDEGYVFTSGDDGFLLRMPLAQLDDPCNLTRNSWPMISVLFGDSGMPALELLDLDHIRATQTRTLINPESHCFDGSEYELETCTPSEVGAGGTYCKLASQWNGMRLRFVHYLECGALSHDFADQLEDIIVEAKIA